MSGPRFDAQGNPRGRYRWPRLVLVRWRWGRFVELDERDARGWAKPFAEPFLVPYEEKKHGYLFVGGPLHADLKRLSRPHPTYEAPARRPAFSLRPCDAAPLRPQDYSFEVDTWRLQTIIIGSQRYDLYVFNGALRGDLIAACGANGISIENGFGEGRPRDDPAACEVEPVEYYFWRTGSFPGDELFPAR
jgi:hypothetical protein